MTPELRSDCKFGILPWEMAFVYAIFCFCFHFCFFVFLSFLSKQANLWDSSVEIQDGSYLLTHSFHSWGCFCSAPSWHFDRRLILPPRTGTSVLFHDKVVKPGSFWLHSTNQSRFGSLEAGADPSPVSSLSPGSPRPSSHLTVRNLP